MSLARGNGSSMSAGEFLWDAQANEYRCPQGFALRSERRNFAKLRNHVTKDDTIIYRSSQHDCVGCSLKQRCCPNTPVRKIARSVHDDAPELGREIAKTPEYGQSSTRSTSRPTYQSGTRPNAEPTTDGEAVDGS